MKRPARQSSRGARHRGAGLALLALTACVGGGPESGTGDPAATGRLGADFGNAVSHNSAQHIVDPAPANALAGAPAMDGARAAGALERYRSGTVIAPEAIETTTFGDDIR